MRDHYLFAWEFLEHHAHERGALWYAVAGALSAALFVWASVTANYLFGLMIVLFVFILFLHEAKGAEMIRFTITSQGLRLGLKSESASERTIPWKDLKNFWIIYRPPEAKSLSFVYKSFWRPHLVVPLEDQDPVKIRRALKKYLDEDTTKEEEPLADVLRRVLRL